MLHMIFIIGWWLIGFFWIGLVLCRILEIITEKEDFELISKVIPELEGDDELFVIIFGGTIASLTAWSLFCFLFGVIYSWF